MSLAGCEIVRKLPGTQAAMSWLMIPLASASPPTNCMIPTSMIATGLLKSSVSAAACQDRLRVPEVGVEIVARAFRGARQQRPGVSQHDRVSFDMHTISIGLRADLRCGPLAHRRLPALRQPARLLPLMRDWTA